MTSAEALRQLEEAVAALKALVASKPPEPVTPPVIET